MTPPSKRTNWRLVCEGLLTLAILWGVYHALHFLKTDGRLPPPFFFDTNDTFMDWFNVAYWAHNPGIYDPLAFGSVYPPISYIFLKLFTVPSCYRFDGFFARDCDWAFPWVFAGIFALNAALVWRCYRRHDRSTALMRTITLTLGLPMLFGVERGQLVLPCFTAFVLANGNILRSARWKWLFAGIAINFKPYLVLTLIPSFLRRRWAALEGSAIMTAAVYLVTYGLLGTGSIQEFASNMMVFGDYPIAQRIVLAYYNTTYVGILMALGSTFPFTNLIGSSPMEAMQFAFPAVMFIGAASVALCFVLALWRPNAIPVRRLTALSVAVVITNSMVGGYTQIFLFFLVFFEPWRGPARITALVAVYLLSLSWDLPLVHAIYASEQSYLSNQLVRWDIGLNLGSLIRPGLILIVEYALVAQSLVDVWKARKPSTLPTLNALPQPA